MSNSNTTQETLEIMKESEKKLVEESVNKNKFISKTPSKEEIEKEGEDTSLRQETQDYDSLFDKLPNSPRSVVTVLFAN